MFRLALPVACVMLALLGVVGTRQDPIAKAQEGTSSSATPTSVETRLLARAYSEVLQASLAMRLVTLQPGESLSTISDGSSVDLIYLGDGILTFQVEEPVTVMRAPVVEGTPTAFEELGADAESTLRPGDSFLVSPNTIGEFRNDETNPAVIFIVSVAPDKPLTPVVATPVS